MDTKKLDIVYFVKDGIKNEELRYSLRSVDTNMPHRRVWIFGGCPMNITPDVRVRVDQTGCTKWDKVRNMYKMACENKEITDNFIMFNDDFFVMQPIDYLEPFFRATLDEHIPILEAKLKRPSEYSRLLRKCRDKLTELGETKLSYELHTPFIFNKQNFLDMLNKYPEMHCARTMYGNLYKVGGRRTNDVKIFNINPSFDYKNSRFISTDDSIVNINNDIWRWLQKQFPKKSKFEI